MRVESHVVATVQQTRILWRRPNLFVDRARPVPSDWSVVTRRWTLDWDAHELRISRHFFLNLATIVP